MHEPSLQRAYGMFLRCHQIVAAATSEVALATDVCRAAVDELGYRLAWIGLREPDDRIAPIAHAGFEQGYLAGLVVRADDGEYGRGPTGTAVRERRVGVCRDIATDPSFEPWRADALARGYGSSVAIPLLQGTEAIGALNLYATEPRAFDEREIALLEEVALDVALGIVALRSTAGVRAQHEPPPQSERSELAGAAAASIVHDLQNMLGVVLLSLSDLAKRLPEHTHDPAYVDANAAVRGAADLARQVLVLGKRASASSDTVDVDACIRSTQALLVRVAGPLATLSLDLRGGRGRVGLGAMDLQRIVINLVLNATQAAGPGVKLHVETRTDAHDVVLRVRDDGPGIPAENLPRVFDPSFTTKGDKGSGLGLASVAELIGAAKGTIDVASELGHGALFTIRLPRSDVAARDAVRH